MTVGHKGIKTRPRGSKSKPKPDTGTPTPPPQNPPEDPAS